MANEYRIGQLGVEVLYGLPQAQSAIGQIGFEVLKPILPKADDVGGHRYWRVNVLTNTSGRVGSWEVALYNAKGVRLRGALSGNGGIYSADRDWFFATDTRNDTAWTANIAPPGVSFNYDCEGSFLPTVLKLGSQPFLAPGECIRTFTVDYSDDNVNWTTYFSELNPQTGWTSTEIRTWVMATPVLDRKRVAQIIG